MSENSHQQMQMTAHAPPSRVSLRREKNMESMERELFGKFYDQHVKNKQIFELKNEMKNEMNNINTSIHYLSEQMVNLQNTSNEIKQDTSEISIIGNTLASAHNDIKNMNSEMRKSFSDIKNQLKGWCTNSSFAAKFVCIIMFVISLIKLIIFVNYLYVRIYRLITKSAKHLNFFKYIPFINIFAGIIDLGIELLFLVLFFVTWAVLTKGLGGVELMEQTIEIMWNVVGYVLAALYKIIVDFYNSDSEFRQVYYRIFNKPLSDINNGYQVVFDLASNKKDEILKFTNDYLVNQTHTMAEHVASSIGNKALDSVNELPSVMLDTVKSATSMAGTAIGDMGSTIGSTIGNIGSTFKGFLKWGGKSKKRRTHRKGKKYTKTLKRLKGGAMNKLALLDKLIRINKEMITLSVTNQIEILSSSGQSKGQGKSKSKSKQLTTPNHKLMVTSFGKGNVEITNKKLESVLDIAEGYMDIITKIMYCIDEIDKKIEENPTLKPSQSIVSAWTNEIMENSFDEEGNFYCDEYCVPRTQKIKKNKSYLERLE